METIIELGPIKRWSSEIEQSPTVGGPKVIYLQYPPPCILKKKKKKIKRVVRTNNEDGKIGLYKRHLIAKKATVYKLIQRKSYFLKNKF